MGDPQNQDTRTLAEYNRSNMDDVQSSISWGNLPVNNFELSAPQIRLIIDTVKFHGLPSESPHRHLAKFMHVSLNLKVNGVPQDEIRLRLFPYTLCGRAEEWLAALPSGSITTWKQMTDRFLEEYFPPEKTARCREEILSFKQYGTETLNECWIRFKDLLRVCPHHGIPIIQLMDKFYNGLDGRGRYTLDMASNGEFDTLKPDEAWTFLEKMSKKSQHWETARGTAGKDAQYRDPPSQRPGVHRVDDLTAISAQMEALSRQVANLNMQPVHSVAQPSDQSSCELCGGGHYTIECQQEYANFAGQNQNPPGPNQFGNTYNPNWRNHPNFSWRSGPSQNNAFPQRPNIPPNQPFQPRQFQAVRPPAPPYQPQYTDKFERRMQDNEANIRNIQATLQNLETQMGQISKLLTERQPGTFPAHTETNPKEQL